MWIYLGILATVAAIWWVTPTKLVSAARAASEVTKQVYNGIRSNGLGSFLVWTRQIIANQLGNRVVEMHHHYYIIHYPYGVNWYKIIVPRRRGPCKIDTVIDGNGNDVKQDVFVYMGPGHIFGIPVTPKMLGYDSLTFTFLNGDKKTFLESDFITI